MQGYNTALVVLAEWVSDSQETVVPVFSKVGHGKQRNRTADEHAATNGRGFVGGAKHVGWVLVTHQRTSAMDGEPPSYDPEQLPFLPPELTALATAMPATLRSTPTLAGQHWLARASTNPMGRPT